MDTAETIAFRRAFLGGLVLFVVGFIFGEGLPLFLFIFTRGRQVPFSKISGEAIAAFFCVNILIKGLLLLFYTRWALSRDLFQGRFALSKWTVVISVIILLLSLILNLSFPQFKTNLLDSWNYFKRLYGLPLGLINTILQYVYYIFEGLVMIWIVDAFQTAGEIRLRKPGIPWGGIALAVLWGIGHIFTKGWLTGFLALLLGIAVGYCYLLDRKNVLAPLLFWMIYNIV